MKKAVLLAGGLCLSALNAKAQMSPLTWESHFIDDEKMSAGFIDIHDFNGDGKKEVVLSTLIESGSAGTPWSAKGAIYRYSMPATGIFGAWTSETIFAMSNNLPFCNYPQILDVNADGNVDILLQQGFLQTNGGSHAWLQGPSFSSRNHFSAETTHGDTYYFWHETEQADLDQDGLLDLITTSAQTQDASHTNTSTLDLANTKIEWYRNNGGGSFSHYVLQTGLGGVFIKLYDVDQDSDLDIVCSQFFGATGTPALVWLECQEKPSSSNAYLGLWETHSIDLTTGLGYHLEFADLNQDGKDELVYVNHNNEDNTALVDPVSGDMIPPGLYYFDIPEDPRSSTQWTKHAIYEGFRTTLFDFGNPESQGTPGIFSIGDIDNNGLLDIAVPGDGNDTLYLFRQYEDLSFQKEIVDNGKMFGHCKIVDLDNDGVNELVAAKHNFPEAWEIFAPPAGFLKVYRPEGVNPIAALPLSAKDLGIHMYPNPAKTSLQLTGNKLDINKIEIVDLQGRIICSPEVNSQQEIKLPAELETGQYLLRVWYRKGMLSLPFVKL